MVEQGVVDRVEQTIETSCSMRRVGLSGALDEALVDRGGIFMAEDDSAGSLAGLLRGVKEGQGVGLMTGKALR